MTPIEAATQQALKSMDTITQAQGKALTSILHRVRDRIMAELAVAKLNPEKYSEGVRYQQLTSLQERYSRMIYGDSGSAGAAKQFQNVARRIYPASVKEAYQLTRNELKGQVLVKTFPMVKMETAKFVAVYQPQLSGLMERYSRDLYVAVRNKIRDGILLGKHPRGIAKMLVNEGLPRGRFNVAETRAWTIAITETPRALNGGKLAFYRGVGVTWVKVVGGTSICDICAPYHGKVYRLEEAPLFPLHPRCTHTYVPVKKDGIGIGYELAA